MHAIFSSSAKPAQKDGGEKDLESIIDRLKSNDPKLIGIKTLFVHSSDLNKFFKALKDNKVCSSVAIYGPGITNAGTKQLRESLKANHHVTYLSLSECPLEAEGIADISKAVYHSRSLRSLIIGPRRNAFGNINSEAIELISHLAHHESLTRLDFVASLLSSDVAAAAGKVLALNAPLKSLNLSHNPLGDSGLDSLAQGLPKNRNLLALYLADVAATQKGWTPLLKTLHRENYFLLRLVLSDNPLDSKTIKQLAQVLETNPRLEELELARCKLGNESALLVASLPLARSIRKLNLSENGIKEIHGGQIADAPTLTDLNLSSNLLQDDSIVHVADQMYLNRSLTALNISKNPFTPQARRAFNVATLENTLISWLSLQIEDNGRGADDVTNKMLDRHAHVNEFKNKMIDSGVKANFTQAQVFGTYGPQYFDVSRLRLTNGELEAAMDALNPHLPGVKHLLLYGNYFTRFPTLDYETLAPTLLSIDLSNNQISTVPAAITQLKALTTLDLRCNKIAEVPVELAGMTTLTHLLLSYNKITAVPGAILKRPNLFLAVTGNQLTDKKVVGSENESSSKNSGGLLASFDGESSSAGSVRWSQMKLQLLGEENVGKTSLARYLTQGTTINKESSILATNGVEIGAWETGKTLKRWRYYCNQCFKSTDPSAASPPVAASSSGAVLSTSESVVKMKKGERCKYCKKGTMVPDQITFTVWDFGGQEVFYPTHQLFLSSRSIYVVMFRLDKLNLGRLEYWLRHINAVSNARPPTFLVGTHRDVLSDEQTQQVVEKVHDAFWNSTYRNVKGIFAISSVNNLGIEDLTNAIVAVAQKNDLLTMAVPAFYITLKQLIPRLKNEFKYYTSWSAMQDRITLYCGLIELTQLKQAMEFFHDVGMLIYFNIAENNLDDLIILDPKWFADMLATVITFRPNFVNRKTGIILHSDLKQLWKNYAPDLHPQLLSLLERFGVGFTLKLREPPQMIIPCLLGPDKPPTTLNIPHGSASFITIQRLYRFNFMPLGFFARVIIGSLYLQPQDFSVWADGMEVLKDGHYISLTYQAKTFELRVEWLVPKMVKLDRNEGQLKTVVEMLEGLFQGFYYSYYESIERFIVCTHCLNRQGSSQHSPTIFKFVDVVKAMELADPAVKCRGTDVKVSLLAPDLALLDLPVLKHVHTDKILGKGGFGQVWRGRWNDRDVAVKELITAVSIDEQDRVANFLSFQKEVAMMSLLDHPNVIKLYGIMLRPFRMVLEFAPCGDLYHYIHKPENQLSWKLRMRIAIDVAKGMRYLHAQLPPVMHRDLRSPNVFLVSLSESATLNAKVADFGLAHRAATGITPRLATWQWMAPETFSDSGKAYSVSADVYSFGIVMWEIASRNFPFQEYEKEKWGVFDFRRRIASLDEPLRPSIDPTWPSEYAKLIRDCWCADPQLRPNFLEVTSRLQEEASERQADDAPRKTSISPQFVDLLQPKCMDRDAYIMTLARVDEVVWAGWSDGRITLFRPDGSRLRDLREHSHRVYAIAASSTAVFTASEDMVVTMWDRHEMRPLRQLQHRHQTALKAVQVVRLASLVDESVDEQLWTADVTGNIHVWACPQLEVVRTMTLSDGVYCMCQHRDGSVYVAGDTTIVKLNPQRCAEEVKRINAHRSRITAIIPYRDSILTGSNDKTIAVWNFKLELLRKLQGHESKVQCLALVHSDLLWSGGFDQYVLCWDLLSSSIAPLKQLPAHEDSVRAILQVDELVWTACVNGELKRWKPNWLLGLQSSSSGSILKHSDDTIRPLSPRADVALEGSRSPRSPRNVNNK